MKNLRLLFVAIVMVAFGTNMCNAQDYEKFAIRIQKDYDSQLVGKIWDMVEKDKTKLSDDEKFYFHASHVFSRRSLNKIEATLNGKYNGWCGYAMSRGYTYLSNAEHFVVEGKDTIYFYNKRTKDLWLKNPQSLKFADENWENGLYKK